MEPEDLPWPGELEEEEEEGEEEREVETAAAAEAEEALNSDETVMVEEVEEEAEPELDSDFNYEFQPRESTDDEEDFEDEEAKAWLQAHPGRTFAPPPPPRHHYSQGELTSPDMVVPLTCHVWQQSYQGNVRTQISNANAVSLETTAQWGSEDHQRTESWHCLPQEMDSSQTLDTTQTRINMRTEGTEVTNMPSLEEGVLTRLKGQVKERNRDLLCSPLLVIQDNFASPDLPLLTCLTHDQEFGPDSLFHQSELDFAPLRGIPDKSEDTEWFSRPSEVSEALFQATSEVSSDLVNSCFSISQYPLTGSTTVGSQRSFLFEQGNNEENVSSNAVNELKIPKDSDNCDLCSHMSQKTRKDIQQLESNLADKDQVSVSTLSDISDENIPIKKPSNLYASCSHVQYWKQEALQQAETSPISKDHVSFPHGVVPPPNNKMSYSFLRCSLERRGKENPLTSDSHYFEDVYLRASADGKVEQRMNSLEGYERNEEDLQKELSQYFKQKDTKNNLVPSEGDPRSSEIKHIGNIVVPNSSVKVSEAHILSRGHDISTMKTSDGPLQTVKSNLDETSQRLYFQEERNQKATSIFGEKNVDATENVAFEAVIASIEPSGKDRTISVIQTDISESLIYDSQEREPQNPDLSPLNYNAENSFFDKLKHPNYHSTPGLFEPAASKPLLHKENDDSSLYWYSNLKSPPNTSQNMLIKPLSVIPELKSSASLSEKSYNQAVGLGKTQSALFQCDIYNEPFLPIAKVKSVSALDLAEKLGSSNIIYPMQVSTSDSLVLQDLKQQTFEEVADSSNYNMEGLQEKAESDAIILGDDTERCSLDESAVVCSERVAELQKETCYQHDVTGEYIELAALENLLDDLCDSSLHWQPALQLPSEKENNFEKPMGHSNLGINQPFSSVSPTFIPHDPTRESEYHSSDLRMLRVSPDTVSKTLKHLTGDTLKGGIAEINQSKLKSGVTTTPGDSDIRFHLSSSLEGLPQLAVSFPQENTIGQRTDTLNQQVLADHHLTEENLKVSDIPEPVDQKTKIPTAPSTFHSHREKPGVLYQEGLPDGHLIAQSLKVSAVTGPADQKAGTATVSSSTYPHRKKPSILYQQGLPDSHLTGKAPKVSVNFGPVDQKIGIPVAPSISHTHRESPGIFLQQFVPEGHLPEEALKVSAPLGPADKNTGIPPIASTSYSQREEPSILYQEGLPDGLLTNQSLTVSAAPGPTDQQTGIPTITSISYLQGDKSDTYYEQVLPSSYLPEETLKATPIPRPADQQASVPTVISSYSQRDKPSIFYQRVLPGSHLPKETLKAAAVPRPAEQQTGVPTVTSTSYSQRDKPGIFYQQTLPGSHLPEETLKAIAPPRPADEQTRVPTVTSVSYSQRDQPGVFYQQVLPGSHPPEGILKAAPVARPAAQQTGVPTVTSVSYSQRDQPGVFYQQVLPGSHPPEGILKAAPVARPAAQQTGVPTVTSVSYSQRDQPGVFYQQVLPGSHPPEGILKAAPVPQPADQQTGVPTVTSVSYSQRDKPGIFYRQTLPGSHLPDETLKASAPLKPADQQTGVPTVTSTSYLQREKPGVFYQQVLPGSHQPEETLKAAPTPRPADQQTGIPTITPTSYLQRDKPSIFYQQVLPSSHLPEEAPKATAPPRPADQQTGVTTVTSVSYSQKDQPRVFYQQTLPGSHLPEETLKAAPVPQPADQQTGVPTVTSVSYSQRDKPGVFYEQTLPSSHPPDETLRATVPPRPADQQTGIPTVTSSYSQRDKPGIFYQQALPASHLPEETLKAVPVPRPAEQQSSLLTVTSTSYSYTEEPGIFYQELPESHLTEESLKVSAASGPAEQKPSIATVSSTSYPHGEKSHTLYNQALPHSHLSHQILEVSPVSESAEQKIGTATVPSTSYSHGIKPGVFYQQELPDSHQSEETLKVLTAYGLTDQKTGIPTIHSSSYAQQALSDSHPTKEPLKVSAVSVSVDQKTWIPTVPSTFYTHKEAPSIFYQQTLSDNHPAEEALQVSVGPGPRDQETGIPSELSGSYSHGEKPIIFSQQLLPGSHLREEALKVSADSGSAEQKSGVPIGSISSYSYREKPSVFYQQELPDSYPAEKSSKVLAVPGPVDQNTGISAVSSASYSHREKPNIFYQETLPNSHLPADTFRVPSVSRLADQIPGISTVTSASYSYKEKSNIFYQQKFPDSLLTEDALKVSGESGLSDQKTETAAVSSTSYSQREKPGIFYQQALPDSHLTEEKVKVSPTPGPADQKTGIATVTSTSYSQRDKPGVFYQQTLPGSPVLGESLKVSAAPGPADLNTGTPAVSSDSYSLGEKSIIFHQQAFSDLQLTKEGLRDSVDPGPVDQNTGIPTVTSSYSHLEKTIVSYQQELPDSHLTEKAVKVSIIPGPTDQKTGIPTAPSISYSHREKPSVSYHQDFPDVSGKAVKVLGGPAEQKTGIQIVSSTPYSPVISYQQEFPDLAKENLKVLGVPGVSNQKTEIHIVPSTPYSQEEKPIISYQQQLPDLTEVALKTVLPGPGDQNIGIPTEPLSYSQPFPANQFTEEALKVSAVSVLEEQRTGTPTGPSGSYLNSQRKKPSDLYQQALADSEVTEESLKALTVPVLADQNRRPIVPTSSYSYKEKPKISAVNLPDNQKSELPIAPHSSYLHGEKGKISPAVGPDDQKTPLLTVFHSSYSQRVKPDIFFQQQLSERDQTEDIPKISTGPKSTDVNTGVPVSLSGSYIYREKSNSFYPQALLDRPLNEDVLKVSAIPEPGDQKTVLLTAPPSSSSHREKQNILYQKDLPNKYLTESALKVSSSLGQADQITGLPEASPDSHSPDQKHRLVSEGVQKLIDNLNSSDSSVSSNNMPLPSQTDDGILISKPESLHFGVVGSEDICYTENSSKTLKEIRTLLMEAENIALKRCNFPAPLVPFRDISDISLIQSKKVVCFKEPSTTDVSNDDLPQRQSFIGESLSSGCLQKDIGTQTNLKCQRDIENWEFISSTTIRRPLQEAESKARVTLDETFRQYEATKSVMRSEPEGCSGTIGNKIIIPMMTIIKSDSSSDGSVGNGSCSWDSNLPESLESVSDVLLNFFPCTSPMTSITGSREEEGVSESEDGCGSVDSLAAHVKNLLQCESSLNHARQILRNAEEEECRVRARAWNLKFNLGHECGYSISELNEDDRRKVEEIKAKLFGHGRATDLSENLQSPPGIGCTPEALCSHIIIESHEKGCFRTLPDEQSQLDNHPCVFRSTEPSEVIRERRSSSPSRSRHISFSKSLDPNNHHFRVWNSLQLQSHPPCQKLTPHDFKVSKGVQMSFREKMDPWLSELVEPVCVPPKEVDFHSSSQILPPEPMKQFTTSITFSSHRHSKCISDSSVFKVGVTEGSQSTGTSMGVLNFHTTEEQNSRDLKQKRFYPSSLEKLNHSLDKEVTILVEASRQGQKLPVGFEHSHQEEKLLERSNFKVSHSEPSISANCSRFKEVQFSDNHTLINMGKPSATLGVREKNVTITPDLSSHIFLERELFEQSSAPHIEHHAREHHSPPCPNLPSCIFLEQRELFEQSKAPHAGHKIREKQSLFHQCQDYIASDLPSPSFLEQCQSKAPGVDDHMRKHHFPLSRGQEYVVEKNQNIPKSYVSSMINVEAKLSNVISQLAPDPCTLATSSCTPPSNRKALSCVRITLCPKTPSKLDSGTLDKRFHSLDPASKTRINSEFNSDVQTISSRSLEPTSKLLTGKPIAQNQESLGFLGPKSPLDLQVVQSPLPDSKTIVTQDLKTVPSQNSQIVTSRQTQVNISDLEGYSKPEGTPVSADGSRGQNKTPSSISPGKLSSDAVTQITTESPEKTMFSSEIFINVDDRGHEILEPSTQKLHKVPVKLASSSSVQQVTTSRGTDAQPVLLPYKPSGSVKMYYVPQLQTLPPSFPDSKSDTTIESSHSGSNDAIAPDFPAQVLGTRDDDLSDTVNIKHKEGIYSKRAVTKAPLSVGKKSFHKDNAETPVQVPITGDEDFSDKKQKEEVISQRVATKTAGPEEQKSLQKDSGGSSDATDAEHSAQIQDTKRENLLDTKAIKQKEKTPIRRIFPKKAWTGEEESLQIDISESGCHSEFENTTHSVFRSAKFYFHHPVHLSSDQDFCHESLGRSVFMRHSWKDFFQHHSDKHREHTCLPSPYQNVDTTKMDYTRIKSLSINLNLGDKEVIQSTKSQVRDHPKSKRQINNEPKRGHKVTPELTTQHTVSLNELWNKYQERQKQQKAPDICEKKELSLVERLDRLAKLLQNPITHSLQASESTQDDSRGERDVKEWSSKQQQQKSKLQKQKRYKNLEKGHKSIDDLKKSKMLSAYQTGRSNQIKIEQIKLDKYILKKQPDLNYASNTSSDSRPSEESELFTDTPTNILSTTTSPVDSDILTQTDKEVALHERSSSISTIDTARLIQAFGHERVCLSPRRIKLYSSVTHQQRRYLEKRCKHNKKALSTGHPQLTSQPTRRRHIQAASHLISSDSVSSASSFLSLNSTLCNKQNVQMLNKGVQAGTLEIVNGAKKHTRDVGVTFPTPSSSEARLEEDSDVTSWSEEKTEQKVLFTTSLGDKKLRKYKQNSCEGVSWFVPVENEKSESKKENLPKVYSSGISWFEPITKIKPWREPLREQNWQGRRTDGRGLLGGPGGDDGQDSLMPFMRATLQESLQLHRPDFISRSGERIKRLKLIVQERKLQNMFQSERNALFNATHLLPKRVFLAVQKNKPIGKKEMIQRSKRIYEQLPEVQKKREEEKRKSEYKSYRLRAQLYKKKVTNQLLGRKVPWD